LNLKLEAFYPSEGAGIVRTERNLFLVRPPYRRRDSVSLLEESVDDAVLKHGFFASTAEFRSWEEVIEFLNGEVAKTRQAVGKDIPNEIDIRDTLQLAPPPVLENFISRIEAELINNNSFDRAENLLVAFLNSNASNRADLSRRAAHLLQINKEKKAAVEKSLAEVANGDKRFASLRRHKQVEKTARLAEAIIHRGCIYSSC
jgi:hypothetical protein